MKLSKRWKRVLQVLQAALLIGVFVYLVFTVSWRDHVVLKGETDGDAGERVVMLEEGDETFVVLKDGVEQRVSRDAVQTLEDTDVPAIEYGVISTVQRVDVGLALLALLVAFPIYPLSAVRLKVMLGIQDERLSLWHALRVTYVGAFFNFVFPSRTGGDLVKVFYLVRETRHKHEAVTTIFLDRLMGLINTVGFASVMMMVQADAALWEAHGSKLGILAAGVVLGGVVVLSAPLRRALRLRQIAERLPLGEHLLRIGAAVTALGRRPGHVATALGLTLALQFSAYSAVFVASRALGMDGSFLLYMVVVPIGIMIAALTPTPQGVGGMEAFFVVVLTAGGLSNTASQALTLALSLRLAELIWALPGGLVAAWSGGAPSRDDLEALEHDDEIALTANTPVVDTSRA